MSGLEILFQTALNYELTHQITLYTLFKKTDLPKYLFSIPDVGNIQLEPGKKLFDLLLETKKGIKYYIEMKVNSTLSKSQRSRQIKKIGNNKLFYIMIGTSWFEYPFHLDQIHIYNKINVIKNINFIGYDQLINGLDKVIKNNNHSKDEHQLASDYQKALQEQFNKIKNAYKYPTNNKEYYYSLLWNIKESIADLKTIIIPVNNRGKADYILQFHEKWININPKNNNTKIFTELYNGKLRIRTYTEKNSSINRKLLREDLQRSVKSALEQHYELNYKSRLGKSYTTICTLEHDFYDITKLDESAKIFIDVSNKLHNIKCY